MCDAWCEVVSKTPIFAWHEREGGPTISIFCDVVFFILNNIFLLQTLWVGLFKFLISILIFLMLAFQRGALFIFLSYLAIFYQQWYKYHVLLWWISFLAFGLSYILPWLYYICFDLQLLFKVRKLLKKGDRRDSNLDHLGIVHARYL